MKTIIKLSAMILFSIIFLNAEAQKITSENRGINKSELMQMKKHTGSKKAKHSGQSDTEANQNANERIAYDAFGNAIWVPNSASYGNVNTYGNPYTSVNNGPGSYYGNSYSNCGPNTNPYAYNNYGNSGWYTPFQNNNGWNDFSYGMPTFYDEYNQPYDGNVTTGDYGLEIPRPGVWLDKVLGKHRGLYGTQGPVNLHEDGFFYRKATTRDGPYYRGKYLVVNVPIGAGVQRVPAKARKVYNRGQEYFIFNKVVFSRERANMYRIVGVLG